MKKLLYIFTICLFFYVSNVSADVTYDFTTGNYHVVYIKNNVSATSCDNSSVLNYTSDNIEYLQSFNSYDDALTYMKTISDAPDKVVAIVGERKNSDDVYVKKILNSSYALVDINTTGSSMVNTNVYNTDTGSGTYTYINGYGSFGAGDAAFINYSNAKQRVNIKISGAIGWINSTLTLNSKLYNGYEVIPIVAVKSPSYYYINDNGELVHRLSKKITASNCYASYINLGPGPNIPSKDSEGNTIKYYSYDSNYFYTSLELMLNDYKNGVYSNAVNKIPYYNYYMYSSVRTKSKVTSDDLKNYLDSRGYKDGTTALYGNETAFTDAQDKYGVNAVIMYATAINESGWGTSTLAKTKNNIFGHNAFDSSVMSSANTYNTVADGIYRHAYYMINTGFVETKDAVGRYYGAHLGNKGSGMNVKYASDAYWGEKIAGHYYSIDNYAESKDYYSSIIGIKVQKAPAPVMSEPNSKSTTLYRLESYYNDVCNMPVIILDKVEGENIDGNNIWYKIQSDALLTTDRKGIIQDSTSTDYYDWDNNYAYIHSSYITLMDESVEKVYTKVDGIFGLHELNSIDGLVDITGYLAITGIDNSLNKVISYDLILSDESGKTYEKPLNRITDENLMPYKIPQVDNYDYTYSWFNGKVDLSDIPSGNYNLYIRSRTGSYESKEILSNMLSIKIASKFLIGNKGFQFKTNYYLKTIPIELFVRDNGLISNENTPTSDNMINQYNDISLGDGRLNISGSSFNVGGDYSLNTNVERTIIFENTETFERYSFDLGYIDNGPYPITLIVPDDFDKTRAWFSNSIDISNLDKGIYSIYIKTKSNIEDASELNDIFARAIESTMSINDKNYSLIVNKNQRFRLELAVD